jgi:hypothetical protein
MSKSYSGFCLRIIRHSSFRLLNTRHLSLSQRLALADNKLRRSQ